MKNRYILIGLLVIILLSGFGGWMIKSNIDNKNSKSTVVINNQATIKVDTLRFVKKIAYRDSIIEYWKTKFVNATLYPHITFLPSKKDSLIPNRDSVKLVHCSEALDIAVSIMRSQDTLKFVYARQIKKVTALADTLSKNYTNLMVQKLQTETQLNTTNYKLKRWQGVGIGEGILMIGFILIKVL